MKSLLFAILFLSQTLAKEVKITVPDLTCQVCVFTMKKYFKSVVKDVDKDIIVNLEDKTVHLKLVKEISEKEIKEQIKKAGYTVDQLNWSP